jgi:hypothetical protein
MEALLDFEGIWVEVRIFGGRSGKNACVARKDVRGWGAIMWRKATRCTNVGRQGFESE